MQNTNFLTAAWGTSLLLLGLGMPAVFANPMGDRGGIAEFAKCSRQCVEENQRCQANRAKQCQGAGAECMEACNVAYPDCMAKCPKPGGAVQPGG